jgi:ribose/xylose/arabinose/galactoside ABC-type transport system permease subunit
VTDADALSKRASAPPAGSLLKRLLARNVLWLLLLGLVAAAEIVSHGAFLQPRNLINILAQNSVTGTVASTCRSVP